MGSTISTPKVVVGKANRNAPSLHRHYGVPDHLYPYEIRKGIKTHVPSIELVLALEAFSSLVSQRLAVSQDIERPSKDELEKLKALVNPIKVLHNALLTDTGTIDYEIEIKIEENQFHLCRNSLVELSDIVCKYTTLTIFHVCCNYLRYLPYGIGQLRSLKMLLLSRNRLAEIPEEIGQCKELKEIDLSYNLIRRLPKSLVSLKRLNTFLLGNNLLTDLPPFIGKMNSLKYLNISHNKVTSIPLEIFKLPFLLSLNCTGCNLQFNQKGFDVIGQITLMETVSRNIIRKNLEVSKTIQKPSIDYLVHVQECTFCGGPFFEHFVNVNDVHLFETELYPIHYKMCCLHYEKHEQRLTTLFERTLETFPVKLFEEKLPSITELFEPYSYEEQALQRIEESAKQSNKIPLICLAKHNTNTHRKTQIDRFFNEELDTFNIFDQIFDQN
ncbi:hypothetical protein GINT2_001871 [Glugoides intestinalis]